MRRDEPVGRIRESSPSSRSRRAAAHPQPGAPSAFRSPRTRRAHRRRAHHPAVFDDTRGVARRATREEQATAHRTAPVLHEAEGFAPHSLLLYATRASASSVVVGMGSSGGAEARLANAGVVVPVGGGRRLLRRARRDPNDRGHGTHRSRSGHGRSWGTRSRLLALYVYDAAPIPNVWTATELAAITRPWRVLVRDVGCRHASWAMTGGVTSRCFRSGGIRRRGGGLCGRIFSTHACARRGALDRSGRFAKRCVSCFGPTVSQPLMPLFYAVGRRMGSGSGDVPVVCVHGYMQNRVDFVALARQLERSGAGPIYGFNYPWFDTVEKNRGASRPLHREGAA